MKFALWGRANLRWSYLILAVLPWMGFDSMLLAVHKPQSFVIAYTSFRGICLAEIETTESRCYESKSISAMRYPEWSPDGKNIVFLGRGLDKQGQPIWALYVLSIDSWDARAFSDGLPVSEFGWSSDQLYFTSAGEDGKTYLYQTVLGQTDPTLLAVWDKSLLRIVLTPDGKRALITERRIEVGTQNPQDEVFIYTFADQKWDPLPVQPTKKLKIGGSWSPDGRNVLYGEAESPESPIEFFVVSPAKDVIPTEVATVALSSYSRLNITWSPDGKSILYDNHGQIFIYDLVNEVTKQLTSDDAWRTHPVWSPDGSMIAYCQYTNQWCKL